MQEWLREGSSMRNAKRISIIATFLIIVGVIGILFTFSTAFGQQDTVTKEQVIKDDINVLHIEIDNGSAEVYPTNEEEVSLTLEARNPEDILTTDLSGDTFSIIVKEKQKKWFNFGLPFKYPKLKVYVPEKDFAEFVVKSDNGRIKTEGIQAETITVSTDNGRVDVANVSGTTVEAQTNNGKINLKDVVASHSTVTADNGKIVLDQVDGDIVSRAGNGAISLKTDDMNRNIDLTTSNGKIDIDTENKPTNAVMDIQVGNGKVRVFGQSTWDTVIGNGDNVIKLRTSNGAITVD